MMIHYCDVDQLFLELKNYFASLHVHFQCNGINVEIQSNPIQ